MRIPKYFTWVDGSILLPSILMVMFHILSLSSRGFFRVTGLQITGVSGQRNTRISININGSVLVIIREITTGT